MVESRDGVSGKKFAHFESFANSNFTEPFAHLLNINSWISKNLPKMAPAMHLFCSVLHLILAPHFANIVLSIVKCT